MLETNKHKNESVNIKHWQSKPAGSVILLLCSNIVFTNLNMMKNKPAGTLDLSFLLSEIALSEEIFQINQFYTKQKIGNRGFSKKSVIS